MTRQPVFLGRAAGHSGFGSRHTLRQAANGSQQLAGCPPVPELHLLHCLLYAGQRLHRGFHCSGYHIFLHTALKLAELQLLQTDALA